MSVLKEARTAYGAGARSFRTPRATEYEALARVTSRLRSIADQRSTDIREIAKGIHDNRRLWAVLAADVADDGNGLPLELRASILSLAEFTNTYSRKVLTGTNPVHPLIEINTAIMRGLRARS